MLLRRWTRDANYADITKLTFAEVMAILLSQNQNSRNVVV